MAQTLRITRAFCEPNARPFKCVTTALHVKWFLQLFKFSAVSAYLCDLCVNRSREKYLTQRSQRYAEIAEMTVPALVQVGQLESIQKDAESKHNNKEVVFKRQVELEATLRVFRS